MLVFGIWIPLVVTWGCHERIIHGQINNDPVPHLGSHGARARAWCNHVWIQDGVGASGDVVSELGTYRLYILPSRVLLYLCDGGLGNDETDVYSS
jgi:hypothetical protein